LTGDARDKVARATGKKVRTLAKAEQVIAAANADPLRFGDLAQRLSEDGVSSPHPVHAREILWDALKVHSPWTGLSSGSGVGGCAGLRNPPST
jgi:hypothetical protein